MKAKIRHVISPPMMDSMASPKSLRDRILNSISPIMEEDDIDDTLQGNSNINSNDDTTTASSNDKKDNNLSKMNELYHQRIISQVHNQYSFEKTKRMESANNIDPTILEIHPCKPLICYVDTNGHGHENDHGNSFHDSTSGTYSKTKSSSTTSTSNINSSNDIYDLMMKQRIVLQNHISNHTIAIVSIIEIIKLHLEQQQRKQQQQQAKNQQNNIHPITMKQIQNTCHHFGFITSIQFMDLHVLQLQTGRRPNRKKNYLNSSPPYLIIHFKNYILIYPF